MRVAIVYDCLYPSTVGGAERWYRGVARRLAARHRVTYVTRPQWPSGATPDVPPGVELVTVGSGGGLYTRAGRRGKLGPLAFGAGVLAHLAGARRRYDVVHTCAFPYFPLLAAGVAERAGGPAVVADWIEIWSREYWRRYLGAAGPVGDLVQRLAVRATKRAFVFSRLYEDRLRSLGYAGSLRRLTGMLDEVPPEGAAEPREPLVVFAGRHIPEKQTASIPAAVALARGRVPDLRAILFGDGPERTATLLEVTRHGLDGIVRCPGFRPWSEIDLALRRASCLVLPSLREGYGLVVAEAAARGTPSIVAAAPDSAASELVEEGVNGFVVPAADPRALAEAITRAVESGPDLVRRTEAWFAANRERLTIDGSIPVIEQLYEEIAARSASGTS
ncbi:MAG: hypothetical protein QOD06_3207 [Candidatus Binatota bacterium]|nr:hypothetical protein [Candidatus Binatota bacterium]